MSGSVIQEGYTQISNKKRVHLLLSSPTSRSLVDTFLECEKLFRAEGLIVNLSGRLNEILQVCPREEITQVHKFAVGRVLDIHDPPTVLTAPD